MNSMPGITMRTRGAESLFGGPLPFNRGVMKRLDAFSVKDGGFYLLTTAGGAYLDVLFPCEYSGTYDTVCCAIQAWTGAPTARVQLFDTDVNGVATGAALGSGTVAVASGGQTITFTLVAAVPLVAGKLYVARFDCTAGTSYQIVTTASVSGNAGYGNWNSFATAYDAGGDRQGCGVAPIAIATSATGKWFGQGLGYNYPNIGDCYSAAGDYIRAGWGHKPVTDRMVYELHADNVKGQGTYADMNELSMFIYELVGATWVEVLKTIGKKVEITATSTALSWAIPQGFLLLRNHEYVVAVGQTDPADGDAVNRMQVGRTLNTQVFPSAVNVGQYGGIGEEAMWPAYYVGAGPIAFPKNTTGASLRIGDVGYHFRDVPTVILP